MIVDPETRLESTKKKNNSRKERMQRCIEYLQIALKAEQEMNEAIHKYNAQYTQNTRLYRIDGILDQIRMILLDVKQNLEDAIEHAPSIGDDGR